MGKKHNDILGEKFGRLTAIEYVGSSYWKCRCDCGNETTTTYNKLKTGHTKSCGCLLHEGGKEVRDLTGQRFGRLVAIKENGRTKQGQAMWLCRCDCGNVKSIASSSLVGGLTKSCGCYNSEMRVKRNLKHGFSYRNRKIRLYEVWCNMLQRCSNPNNEMYKNYGGRGIKVCEEWHDFATFKEWAYASGYDENAERYECTIDRIDNNGNYEPSNCRWVDMKTQAKNTRKVRLLTVNGVTKPLTLWAEEQGIQPSTIRGRLRIGWTPEEAVLTKVMKGANGYVNYRISRNI